MQARVAIVFSALLLSACASTPPAPPVPAPAAPRFTDENLARFKRGMLNGCTERGLERGDDPAYVQRFCTCAQDVLEANLTRAQWEEALVAGLEGSNEKVGAILEPQIAKMAHCKKPLSS